MVIGAILLLLILGFLIYWRARAKFHEEIAKHYHHYEINPKVAKRNAQFEAVITGVKWTFFSVVVFIAFLVWVTYWID